MEADTGAFVAPDRAWAVRVARVVGEPLPVARSRRPYRETRGGSRPECVGRSITRATQGKPGGRGAVASRAGPAPLAPLPPRSSEELGQSEPVTPPDGGRHGNVRGAGLGVEIGRASCRERV